MDIQSHELRNKPAGKLFVSYLVPSVLGMVLMSLNILVDGIFVSNGVGKEALAAVNIAVPVYSILLSLSLWIGIGGATLYSIEKGRGDIERAKSIFTQAFIWAILIVGIVIVLCLWQERNLVLWFGADQEILPYALDYLHIILLFGLVYVLENILSIFIRNDGSPNLAMAGLIVNSVLNIVLNYIFIFRFGWGIKGAAYATIIATFIGLFILGIHFLKRTSDLRFVRCRLERQVITDIIGIGLPSFIAEGTAALITIGFNVSFMYYVGPLGVTSFAVVNYLHAVFIMLFIAVGSAIQPLVSYHYGAELFERAKKFLKYAIYTGVMLGIVIFLICFFFGDELAFLFGVTTGKVLSYTSSGLGLFAIGYAFLAYNMVSAEYYQAIKRTRAATMIILLRSTLLFIPLLLILPYLFGGKTIWLAFPGAEVLTALIVVSMQRSKQKRQDKEPI